MIRLVAAPARRANVVRNDAAEADRATRWRPARDALWAILDRHVAPGARVAVVGAGNGHDLPLTRLLARAGHVDLIDVHRGALRRALRSEPPALRERSRALTQDVTGGAADRIVHAARAGSAPRRPLAPASPVGRARTTW